MTFFKSLPDLTRRDFLTAGLAAGATIAASASLPGIVQAIPVTRTSRRMRPEAWLPDPPSAELFRRLATAAMDAAKSAGADFADIRIGVQRDINVPSLPYSPWARLAVGYGVRACVNGTWGFQHGSLLSSDAIVGAARSAVLGAQRYAATNARLGRRAVTTLAPAPTVTGEWHGPMQIDPFTVPLDDYYRAMDPVTETMARVHQNHRIFSGGLVWQAETRVFASTDGSLVTQYFMRGGLGVGGQTNLPGTGNAVNVDLPGLDATSAGFESALRPGIVDYVLTGMDEAIRLRELPGKVFDDVGRFPIVFDGTAMAVLMGTTASLALDGDRVFGIEADASGGSFLTPPDEILNATTPQFSPLLNVSVDRALPSITAVQWDDDGVVPEPYTMIRNGQVVDYHTTRETAPMLADWYHRHGRPLRSHGGSTATTPASLPVSGGEHVTVAPTEERVTIEELTRDMTHGFVLRGGWANLESGLTAGTFRDSEPVIEIVRGKAVALTSIPLQFVTKTILKNNLVAIGDASTMRTTKVWTDKGIPWQGMMQQVTAPAVLCKDVDVITWGRR